MIGAEYVELDSGARIAFTTRSASAGRGLSIDRLIVDEAEDSAGAGGRSAGADGVLAAAGAVACISGPRRVPMHDSEAFATMRSSRARRAQPSARLVGVVRGVGRRHRRPGVVAAGQSGRRDGTRSAAGHRRRPGDPSGRSVPRGAVVACGCRRRRSRWCSTRSCGSRWPIRISVPVRDLAIGVDAPPSRDAATVCLAGRRADGRLHVEWYPTAAGSDVAAGVGRRPISALRSAPSSSTSVAPWPSSTGPARRSDRRSSVISLAQR